jgi:hypothetical protein
MNILPQRIRRLTMGEYETSKYLCFEELESKTKTKQFAVRNKTQSFILGYVKWYGPWRRYCFFIDKSGLVFDAECLADIQDFLKNLMLERKYESEAKRLNALKHGLDITSIEGN